MSGHEDAHLLGCVQEHTLFEEFIGRTAYLPVLYWSLPFPHLDHVWMSNEGIAKKKGVAKRDKEQSCKKYIFLTPLSFLTENMC